MSQPLPTFLMLFMKTKKKTRTYKNTRNFNPVNGLTRFWEAFSLIIKWDTVERKGWSDRTHQRQQVTSDDRHRLYVSYSDFTHT